MRFLSPTERRVSPRKWLSCWAAKYPERSQYNEDHYRYLIGRQEQFSSADLELIGRWKDRANTDARWGPNVASVGYAVWKQAAAELPRTRLGEIVPDTFLADWSSRQYVNRFKNGTGRKARFGLSRATTLLHFISRGKFPIFDSRVRRAIKRLGSPVPNKVEAYLNSYCPMFREIARVCGTRNFRDVDKALFSYGKKRAATKPRVPPALFPRVASLG
jgi:hypothetical protein